MMGGVTEWGVNRGLELLGSRRRRMMMMENSRWIVKVRIHGGHACTCASISELVFLDCCLFLEVEILLGPSLSLNLSLSLTQGRGWGWGGRIDAPRGECSLLRCRKYDEGIWAGRGEWVLGMFGRDIMIMTGGCHGVFVCLSFHSTQNAERRTSLYSSRILTETGGRARF